MKNQFELKLSSFQIQETIADLLITAQKESTHVYMSHTDIYYIYKSLFKHHIIE